MRQGQIIEEDHELKGLQGLWVVNPEYAVLVVIEEVNHMTLENVVSSPITSCHRCRR